MHCTIDVFIAINVEELYLYTECMLYENSFLKALNWITYFPDVSSFCCH